MNNRLIDSMMKKRTIKERKGIKSVKQDEYKNGYLKREKHGQVDELTEEMKSYLGLTETKKKDKGLEDQLYWSGVEDNQWGAEDVGLLMKRKMMRNVIEDYKYMSE